MKKVIYLLTLVFFIGCSSTTVKKEDIPLLNGYWEISSVIFPDGTIKEYKASPTVDFFMIEEMQGFRKKVQPRIDGSFNTNNDADKIIIREKESTFTIYYTNELTEREEKIINLNQDSFSIKNQEQIIYIYTRYNPIELQ